MAAVTTGGGSLYRLHSVTVLLMLSVAPRLAASANDNWSFSSRLHSVYTYVFWRAELLVRLVLRYDTIWYDSAYYDSQCCCHYGPLVRFYLIIYMRTWLSRYLNALTVIFLRRPLVVHFFVELVLLVCVSNLKDVDACCSLLTAA